MPNINGLTLISNITGDSKDKKSDLYPADLKEIAVYVTNTDANPVKVSFASDQGSERAWKRIFSDVSSNRDTTQGKEKDKNKDEAPKRKEDTSPLFKSRANKAETPAENVRKIKKTQVSPADLMEAESLNDILPLGLLLLHTDLEKISKKSSSVGAAAAGAAGGGLLSSLVGATSQSFKMDPAMVAIISDPNIQSKLKDDPEVFEVIKTSTMTYIGAFYSTVLKQFGIMELPQGGKDPISILSTTLGALTGGVGSAVGAVLGGIVNQVESAILLTGQTIKQGGEIAKDDPDIQEIHRQGMKTYLSAYYASILQQFGIVTLPESSGNGVIDFINGTLSVISGIAGTAGNAVGAAFAGLSNQIASSINSLDAIFDAQKEITASDEDLKEIHRQGMKTYLSAYYASILKQFGIATLPESTGNKVMDFINGALSVVGAAGGAIGQAIGAGASAAASQVNQVDSIAEMIKAAQADLNERDDIREIHLQGTKAYLSSYYAYVLSQMGISDLDSDIDFKGKPLASLSKFLSGITKSVGAAKGNAYASSESVKIMVDSLKGLVDAEDLKGDEIIDSMRRTYTRQILSAYYANVIHTMGYDEVNDSEDSSLLGTLKNWVTKAKTSVSEISGTSDILSSIESLVDTSDLKSDSDILAIRKKNTEISLNAYYAKLISRMGLDSSQIDAQQDFGIFGAFKKVLTGEEGLIPDTNAFEKNLKLLQDVSDLKSDADILAIRKKNTEISLSAYYAKLLSRMGLDSSQIDAQQDFGIFGAFKKVLTGEEGLIPDTNAFEKNLKLLQDVSDLKSDADILAIRKKNTEISLSAYYAKLLSRMGISSSDIDESADHGILGAFKKVLTGNAGFTPDVQDYEKKLKVLLDPSDMAKDPEISNLRKTATKAIFSAYVPKIEAAFNSAVVDKVKVDTSPIKKMFELDRSEKSDMSTAKVTYYKNMVKNYTEFISEKLQEDNVWQESADAVQESLSTAFKSSKINLDTKLTLSSSDKAGIARIQETLSSTIKNEITEEVRVLSAIKELVATISGKVSAPSTVQPVYIPVETQQSPEVSLAQ